VGSGGISLPAPDSQRGDQRTIYEEILPHTRKDLTSD
jgi:hypothetical protein